MSLNKREHDPVRSLNLLWGSQTTPGRSGLTVRKIVEAGMEIADEGGIEQLSMRKVAERLGVGAMSLYTYVPGKTELLELMVDAANAGLYPTEDIRSELGGDWRDAVRFIAKTNWELFMKHPWIVDLSGRRPVLGPHIFLKYEVELRALEGIGLADIEMDSTLSLILMHVESCARLSNSMKSNRISTGVDDDEWWLNYAPALERMVDWKRFPVASRVGVSAGQAHQNAYNPEHAYVFGLERIIEGTGVLIERGKKDPANGNINRTDELR
ncbi:TetR/AcrR family transcriptional regulator [Paenibacillus lactis]|jgi:AcrR family transcriptional regulator|uniref:TetR/AcrR family transcriptional regulator n=1 Tax=Paenibacillus lactis TaxID=228574 RepID=UPI00203D2F14|nr:TetR/AcrR family transcriptional regulator [Paenibacillus lactis]MCM3494375.1 TetR/AcrR family transcriptional regulator [Paenibacillus lactis]